MANTLRIKRRSTGGQTGAPGSLYQAELAYNESDPGNGVLYIGIGSAGAGGTATSIVPIGGDGAYVTLNTSQNVSGSKTFSGAVTLSGGVNGNTTFNNNLTITGDLTVNGTTTTINSTIVSVDDKLIELGATASPTDAGADSGGILLKGTTDKYIKWLDATDSWTFNQSVELEAGKAFRIDGTEVLSKTTLGSGVTGSSLTSVGTLASGTWQGTTIGTAYGGTGVAGGYSAGDLLIGTSGGGLAKAQLTAGSNITITPSSGGITIAASGSAYTAGDGLDLVGSEFSVDLKANGGLIIESTELAVDLSASNITGTLAIADGGTGATSASAARTALGLAIGTDVQAYDAELATLAGMASGTASSLAALTAAEAAVIDGSTSATATTLLATDKIVVNDGGTMVQVALSDLVTFFEDGTVSGFDLDGGVF